LQLREKRVEKVGGQRRLAEQEDALEHLRGLEGARHGGDGREKLRLGRGALGSQRRQQAVL
jgi:hypothetical protein